MPRDEVSFGLIAVPPFMPRAPWLSADLQTVRNFVTRPAQRFDDALPRRMRFDMTDGTGDVLIGELHRTPAPSGRPLAVLIHGVTGCAESAYMLAAARHLLDCGFPVLRLNLRGCGPSQGLCRDLYHAGRSQDLRRMLERLDPTLTRRGVVAVGFSLGANVLLKLLGELGARAPVRRAASVSAPIDLAEAVVCIDRPRNRLYAKHLLRSLKAETLASRGGLDGPLVEAARRVRTIAEFDEAVTAPRFGFASARDYYRKSSAVAYLGEVRIPTLIIHAADDPWIPITSYRAVEWGSNPALVPVLTPQGGHVGFHGADSPVAWHNRIIAQFLAQV